MHGSRADVATRPDVTGCTPGGRLLRAYAATRNPFNKGSLIRNFARMPDIASQQVALPSRPRTIVISRDLLPGSALLMTDIDLLSWDGARVSRLACRMRPT
jgi:hypothetical protein